MIKNIIFDVGKVLIDWYPHETMKKLGFNAKDIEAIDEILFQSGAWNEEDISIKNQTEKEEYFASLSSKYSDKIRLFYKHSMDSATLRDYTLPLLQSIKSAGYNTYILSNFGKGAKETLEKKGIFDFLKIVDGSLFSYEIHEIKPYPVIYKTLLEKYNLNAEECIFLDDVQKNIDGVTNVGINGILFNNLSQAIDELKIYGVIFERNF